MRKDALALLIVGIALAVSTPTRAAQIEGQVVDTTTIQPAPANEETLRGIIASVDERNDKVTIRLPSDETTELKVGDGLLFDALRYGDAVRATIRTIGGAKEIVGVIRE